MRINSLLYFYAIKIEKYLTVITFVFARQREWDYLLLMSNRDRGSIVQFSPVETFLAKKYLYTNDFFCISNPQITKRVSKGEQREWQQDFSKEHWLRKRY